MKHPYNGFWSLRLCVLAGAVASLATPALAQLGEAFRPPEVHAPVLEVWVFEQPVMPMVVLVVVGLAAMLTLRRSGKARAGLITMGACVLVAAGLWVSSSLVTTDRERVAQVSRAFIEAVASDDQSAAGELMRPTVSLRMSFGARAESREALLNQIGRLHTEATVRGARVLESHVDVRSPTLARAYVRVKVEGSVSGFPIPPYSWWEMSYAIDGDPSSHDWRLAGIEPLWIVGVDNPAGR
ncbi:MAG: hypothetical protein ACI89L_000650 [Phycisphaerales bacterium]|jgi:hypothetical protein